ncbi:MAG: hypothetical protein EU533_02040 [Promethearchaeota archaeon]|nr:MAG: hypothetical protein EU533_02040 [Candidatus Lokiarchaeota archaeon]
MDLVDILRKGSCCKCNESPVIFRRSSGQNLCTNCFKSSIEKIIYKTISLYGMLNPDDKVIIAFSGGISSTCLLYNLYIIQQRVYRGNSITALTIDDGFNPEFLKKMNNFCEKYLIEQIIISSEKNKKTYNKFNKNWIKLRYDFIHELINYSVDQLEKDTDFNVLCLGINLTDIAELCLNHLLKETKFFLRSKNKKFTVITPLMRIPEEEIYIYSKLNNFDLKNYEISKRKKTKSYVREFLEDCTEYSPEINYNLFKVYLELLKIGFLD